MAYCCRHGLLLSLTKQLTFIEITEAGNCHFSHLNAPRTNRATSKKNNKNPSTFGKDSQLAAMTTVIDKHNEIIELINQRASSSKRSAAGAVTRQFQQKNRKCCISRNCHNLQQENDRLSFGPDGQMARILFQHSHIDVSLTKMFINHALDYLRFKISQLEARASTSSSLTFHTSAISR